MPSELRDDPVLASVPEVDGYKVLEPCVLYAPLGRGGMGSVYRGRHLNLGLDVAVKCLKASLAAEDPEFVQRFQREARVAASVNDSNLIRTYDVGKRHELHYLVMEYVDGENLRDRVQRKGALSLDEALTIAIGAARGLAAAHAEGVIHRDIKPGNILISRRGRVKVADLGLAKATDGADSLATATHLVLGTPQYMPPEQFESAKSVGKPGDVHALASCLWFMLTGRDAIAPGTVPEVMRRVLLDAFPDIRRELPDIPFTVSAVIEKATRRDPSERYAHAGELRDMLQEAARSLGLKASLADDAAGAARAVNSMVSPPPPAETVTKIKTAIESGRLGSRRDSFVAGTTIRSEESLAPTAEAPASEPPAEGGRAKKPKKPKKQKPVSPPDHAGRRRRLSRRGVGLAVAVLGLLSLGWILFGDRIAEADPRYGPADVEPAQLVPAAGMRLFIGVNDVLALHEYVDELSRRALTKGGGDVNPVAEMTETFLGLPMPSRRDVERYGLAGSGVAIALYDDIELAAFRCENVRAFRDDLVRHWQKDTGRDVEVGELGRFVVVKQLSQPNGYSRRAAIFDGKVVYFSLSADPSHMVGFLETTRKGTLGDDSTFRGRTGGHPMDRDLTLYFPMTPDLLPDDEDGRELLAGLDYVSASANIDGLEADLLGRAALASGSILARVLKPSGDSLLGRFSTENALAAVELALDRGELMGWLDRTTLGAEMRAAEADFRDEFGFDYRKDVLDRLDGRVAWITGAERAGRIDAADRKAMLTTDSSRFPIDLSYDLRRYVRDSERRLWLDVPSMSMAFGTTGDSEELVDVVAKNLPKMARRNDPVRISAEGSGEARKIRFVAPEEQVDLALELRAREGHATLALADGGVEAADRAYGKGTFGPESAAVARLWVDTGAVGRWLRTTASDRTMDDVYRAMEEEGKPLALGVMRHDDDLVAAIRVGSPVPWRTVRHPLWAWVAGLVALGGLAAAFWPSR